MRALLPLLAGCAAGLAACAAPGPERACAGAFTLSNQSGRDIEQFYAGGTQDLMAPSTMASGTQRSFIAANPGATRLRAVFTAGRAVELGPLNICDLPLVAISAAGIRASAR